jgi:hypothetical protein
MLSTELAGGDKTRIIPEEIVARVKQDLGLKDKDTYARDTLRDLRVRLGSDYVVAFFFDGGMKNMKSPNSLLLFVALAVLSTSAIAKSKSDIRDVTGCLSNGKSANKFVLNGDDGSMWEAKSSRVNLGKHVGHTVTLTGVVSHAMMHNVKEGAKDVAQYTGASKHNNEHGHLKVTNVNMVSTSCRK